MRFGRRDIPNKARKSSIRIKIILAMIILVIGGTFFSTMMSYSKTEEMTLNTIKEDLQMLLTMQKNTVVATMDKERAGTKIRSADSSLKNFLEEDKLDKNSEKRVEAFKQADKVIDHWMEGEEDRLEHIFLVNDKGIIIADSNKNLINRDINDRAYVRGTLGKKTQQISEVVKSKATGAYTFIITAPIFEGDKVIGFLGTSVFTETVTKYLDENTSEDSYICIVDAKDNLLYHPDEEKIGKPVEIEKISLLVEEMNSNTEVIKGEFEYKYQEQEKVGVYESIPEVGWLVVHAMNKKVITDSVFKIAIDIGGVGVIGILVALLIALTLSKKISDPIEKITKLLQETEQLNLTNDSGFEKLAKAKDEIGDMCRATLRTREVLRSLIQEVQDVADVLVADTKELQTFIRIINENITHNSTTIEEISAGMEETAATTQEVSATTIDVTTTIVEMSNSMRKGKQVAYEITEVANKMTDEARESLDEARITYEQVKDSIEKALEESKKIEQIQLLADSILQITRQTNLLALNASIEAARAGEAGRGFAVVAEEVGKLAEQSSKTATTIQRMINEVLGGFDKIKLETENALIFMEEGMRQNFETTSKIGDRYSKDSDHISEIMTGLNKQTEILDEAIGNISHAMQEVALTTTDNAKSVQDISEQTNSIIEEIAHVNEMTEQNHIIVEELQKLISQFTIR